MTNESLIINCEELMELKSEYPLEITVIMEMLSEAGEGCNLEMSQLEQPLLQSAA